MSKNTVFILILLIIVGIGIWWFVGREELEVSPTENQNQVEEVESENGEISENEEAEDGEVVEFRVTGADYAFDPTEIKVKEGDRVRIVFVSEDMMHDWVLDEFDARTEILPAGQEQTIEFVADQVGEFEYYCSVGNHRAMGMVGTLIVE